MPVPRRTLAAWMGSRGRRQIETNRNRNLPAPDVIQFLVFTGLRFWRWPDGSARDAGIRTLALHFCDEGLPLSCERGSMSLGGQMFGLRVAILLPAFTLSFYRSRMSRLACFRMGICHPIPQRNCGRFTRPSLIPPRERTGLISRSNFWEVKRVAVSSNSQSIGQRKV